MPVTTLQAKTSTLSGESGSVPGLSILSKKYEAKAEPPM